MLALQALTGGKAEKESCVEHMVRMIAGLPNVEKRTNNNNNEKTKTCEPTLMSTNGQFSCRHSVELAVSVRTKKAYETFPLSFVWLIWTYILLYSMAWLPERTACSFSRCARFASPVIAMQGNETNFRNWKRSTLEEEYQNKKTKIVASFGKDNQFSSYRAMALFTFFLVYVLRASDAFDWTLNVSTYNYLWFSLLLWHSETYNL